MNLQESRCAPDAHDGGSVIEVEIHLATRRNCSDKPSQLIEPRKVVTVNFAHKDHRSCRSVGDKASRNVPRGELASIDNVQSIKVFLLDDMFSAQMTGKGSCTRTP